MGRCWFTHCHAWCTRGPQLLRFVSSSSAAFSLSLLSCHHRFRFVRCFATLLSSSFPPSSFRFVSIRSPPPSASPFCFDLPPLPSPPHFFFSLVVQFFRFFHVEATFPLSFCLLTVGSLFPGLWTGQFAASPLKTRLYFRGPRRNYRVLRFASGLLRWC